MFHPVRAFFPKNQKHKCSKLTFFTYLGIPQTKNQTQ